MILSFKYANQSRLDFNYGNYHHHYHRYNSLLSQWQSATVIPYNLSWCGLVIKMFASTLGKKIYIFFGELSYTYLNVAFIVAVKWGTFWFCCFNVFLFVSCVSCRDLRSRVVRKNNWRIAATLDTEKQSKNMFLLSLLNWWFDGFTILTISQFSPKCSKPDKPKTNSIKGLPRQIQTRPGRSFCLGQIKVSVPQHPAEWSRLCVSAWTTLGSFFKGLRWAVKVFARKYAHRAQGFDASLCPYWADTGCWMTVRCASNADRFRGQSHSAKRDPAVTTSLQLLVVRLCLRSGTSSWLNSFAFLSITKRQRRLWLPVHVQFRQHLQGSEVTKVIWRKSQKCVARVAFVLLT